MVTAINGSQQKNQLKKLIDFIKESRSIQHQNDPNRNVINISKHYYTQGRYNF